MGCFDMMTYSRKALPSIPDFLRCESEKILEGKKPYFPLPRSFAEVVLYYGDDLFNDYGRNEARKELEGKIRRLNRMELQAHERVNELWEKFDGSFYWERLSKLINNPKSDDVKIETVIRDGEGGFCPRITREEMKEMIDAIGSPQLRTYVSVKILECGDPEKALEKAKCALEEYSKIYSDLKSTQEAISILRDFSSFPLTMMESLRGYYLDSSLLKRFEERRLEVRVVGYRLKNE